MKIELTSAKAILKSANKVELSSMLHLNLHIIAALSRIQRLV